MNQTPPEPEFHEDYQAQANATVIPHSREGEEALIGCVFIAPETYYEASAIVKSDDFYIHRNKRIWDAFGFCVKNKIDIDLATVADVLFQAGQLQEIGGPAYLTALVNQCPSSLNVLSYARMVEGYSVRRGIINKANSLATIGYDLSIPVEDVLSRYDKIVEDRVVTSALDDTQDSDEASLDLLNDIQNGIPTGVLSGFPNFDDPEALGGYPSGATLLLGDSSFGKSAVVLQTCEQVALSGKMAVYIGLESSNKQMVARRVSGISGVDRASKKIRTASLQSHEKKSLTNEIVNNYQGKYKGKLKFNSKATTIRQIENIMRNYHPAMLVVDQISQIMDAPTTNATLNLLDNFRRLKALGNKYDCAVIVVHAISPEESRQFFKKNQKSNGNNGKVQKNTIPDINAIPWASQIKFLADVILFLVPEVNQKLSNAVKYEIIIWVMKDRDGQRFTDCWFDYDLKLQWFTDKIPAYKQQAQIPTKVRQASMMDYSLPEPEFEDLDISGVK